MRIRRSVLALAAACAASTLTACASSGTTAGSTSAGGDQSLRGQTVTVAAVWSGAEQASFEKVLAAFTAKTGIKTQFTSTGDNLATVIGSKIAGGDAMDVAIAPQVGVLKQFAAKGWLTPLEAPAQSAVRANLDQVWQDFGTVDGTLYGVYYKAAFKSLVWYAPSALNTAGVASAPTSWSDFLADAKTVSDSGTPAFAVGGQDGWTLTDWFENVYLAQAGPQMYDKLTQHQIKWTDPSVIKALTTLGSLFGNQALLAGGNTGALHTDFPTSVSDVFGPKPKAAMVYEGDFVGGVVAGLGKKVGTDAKFFPFPAADGGHAPVVGGGDAAVILKAGRHQQAAQALVAYLATPDAAAVWAKEGGFLSPNKNMPASAYTDDTTRSIAQSLRAAGNDFRFDMSDQAPPAFGGTPGAGEWKLLQDFLAKPTDAAGTAAKLEAAAAAAYGS